MQHKKTKKSKWLVLNGLLFLVIALSVLAVQSQNLNVGKSAAGNSPLLKLSPTDNACLNSRKVNLSFSDGVGIGTTDYPHDAFFAVYDSNGKTVAQSNWLAKAVNKRGQTARWATTLPADGRYTWRIRVKNNAGVLSAYDSSPFAFSIDTIPPVIPQCYASRINKGYYGSSEEQSLVRLSWEPGGTDIGCGSNKALLYQVQISVNDANYSRTCASTYWSKNTYQPGQSCRLANYDKGYARIRARDGAGNWTNWNNCYWGN